MRPSPSDALLLGTVMGSLFGVWVGAVSSTYYIEILVVLILVGLVVFSRPGLMLQMLHLSPQP